MASALGFGAAYYFDAENGGLRRKRLHRTVDQAARSISARLVPPVGEPPVVFHPLLRSRHDEGAGPQRIEARALRVVAREVVPSSLVRGAVALSGPSLRRPDPSHLAEVGPVT